MRAVTVNCYRRHRGKVNDLVMMGRVWGDRKSLISKMNSGTQHRFKEPTLDDLEFP
jgi:hypothetical protein